MVEVVGSPCLKESLETRLSDVLNDSTEVSAMNDDTITSEKVIAEIFSDVEDGGPNRNTNSCTPDGSALKGAPNMTSLPQTGVASRMGKWLHHSKQIVTLLPNI